MQKNKPLHHYTDFGLAKLEQLVAHLKSCSLPVADELQSNTLLISKTLTAAYTEKNLSKKKHYYEKTLSCVNIVLSVLRTNFDKEIISPYRIYIIVEDLKSLASGLEDIINLLQQAPQFSNNQ